MKTNGNAAPGADSDPSPLERRTVPHYVYILEDIKRKIREGAWLPGQRLPSEDELALQYHVSRMTSRRALTELVSSGALYRRHGAGTFIAFRPFERDHTRLTSFFANCRAQGIEPSVRVLRREVVPASPHAAEALDVPPQEPMIRIETLRLMDGVPVTLHDAQVPQKLFPWLLETGLVDLRLDAFHLWEVLETHGCRIANATERLEARHSNDYVAHLLHVAPGSPILYGARVIYSDDGTPVKYADCYNRGDQFSVNIRLTK